MKFFRMRRCRPRHVQAPKPGGAKLAGREEQSTERRIAAAFTTGTEEKVEAAPANPKVCYYRRRFNLPLESRADHACDAGAREYPGSRQFQRSAIQRAIADLRGELARVDRIIHVLEWLAPDPPRPES